MSRTDPGTPAVTRRRETVTMPVPDARIADSRASMLGAPPVPRISREASVVPAISKGSSISSASLGGPEDLDVIACGERSRVPCAARDDLRVDRYCDAAQPSTSTTVSTVVAGSKSYGLPLTVTAINRTSLR